MMFKHYTSPSPRPGLHMPTLCHERSHLHLCHEHLRTCAAGGRGVTEGGNAKGNTVCEGGGSL